jgi:hypothetical protein
MYPLDEAEALILPQLKNNKNKTKNNSIQQKTYDNYLLDNIISIKQHINSRHKQLKISTENTQQLTDNQKLQKNI